MFEELLEQARTAQTVYWEAVRELEAALNIELDGQDLSNYTVEQLVKAFHAA